MPKDIHAEAEALLWFVEQNQVDLHGYRAEDLFTENEFRLAVENIQTNKSRNIFGSVKSVELMELIDHCGATTTNGFELAIRSLIDKHLRREHIISAENAKQLAFSPDFRPADASTSKSSTELFESWRFSVENEGGGLPIMLSNLGESFDGWHMGKKYDVIAESGVGKTVVAMNLLRLAVQSNPNLKACFFSFEMDEGEFGDLLYSNFSGLPVRKLREFERDEIRRSLAQTGVERVFAEFKGATCDELSSRIREAKKRHGVNFVVIDYVDYIHRGPYESVGDVCLRLREIAKEHHVCILQLNQIDKESTKPTGNGKRRVPRASDALGGIKIKASSGGCLVLYNRNDLLCAYWDKLRSPRNGEYKKHHYVFQMDWPARRIISDSVIDASYTIDVEE